MQIENLAFVVTLGNTLGMFRTNDDAANEPSATALRRVDILNAQADREKQARVEFLKRIHMNWSARQVQ